MVVERERRGRVLVITMQREAKRNAIDPEMTAGLDAALNELEDDPELWVGVLSGTAQVFSAGTDLKEGSGERTARGGEYGLIRRVRTKPLVAAVEKLALGGGFELVMACDLVVAADDAVFGLPEVRRGVVASSGALFRVARVLPLGIAKQLLLTGQPLDAARAHHFGLVNELCPPGGALDAAVAMAEAICANAPMSVRASLRAVDRLVAADDAEGWEATAEAVAAILGSQDRAEGVSAFFERREPRWTGR